MSIVRMAERLSGRWPDCQGFCGVRDFDEPQAKCLLSGVKRTSNSDGGTSESSQIRTFKPYPQPLVFAPSRAKMTTSGEAAGATRKP